MMKGLHKEPSLRIFTVCLVFFILIIKIGNKQGGCTNSPDVQSYLLSHNGPSDCWQSYSLENNDFRYRLYHPNIVYIIHATSLDIFNDFKAELSLAMKLKVARWRIVKSDEWERTGVMDYPTLVRRVSRPFSEKFQDKWAPRLGQDFSRFGHEVLLVKNEQD